jgi:NADH:ubiquinone oxidoreductase subunit F (NADH-binding)/NADH:ubiquinone oxidoreductase subunit E/Pyruvate/2-oxoacid:ferredoxin oxidoreductase delta subunit
MTTVPPAGRASARDTTTRWCALARTWSGPVAAVALVVSAAWLVAAHVQARRAEPVEQAFVDALRARARTDPTVQATLVPELDRQTKALLARRVVYRRTGVALLVASAALLVWVRWLRPAPGEGAGAPRALLAFVERPPAGRTATVPTLPLRFQPLAPPGAPDPRLRALLAALPAHVSEDAGGLAPVDAIVREEGREPEAAIPILQAVQAHYRYLPPSALRRICETTAITPAQLSGVATLYDQFRHRPVGEHIVRVCEGTACHVAGAVEVGDEIRRCLGIRNGEDTDPTGHFTIERVACVGSCSLAPVVTIDDAIRGHVAPIAAGAVLREFLDDAARRRGARSRDAETGSRRHGSLPGTGTNGGPRPVVHAAGTAGSAGTPPSVAPPIEIRVGVGSCGIASGARRVQAALEDEVRAIRGDAVVQPVGCAGLCHHEPLVEVVTGARRTLYGNVDPDDVRAIVRAHVPARGAAARIRAALDGVRARLLDDRAWVPLAERQVDPAPYTAKQVRVVLENCGRVDPSSLDAYRARGGMRGLEACLAGRTPEQVVEEVRAAGLRGRGGAGFPTARKWDLARRSPGPTRFLVCNADEGDPGAFMDRAVLESDPFRVIEGMAIAAYAVGAAEGIVYVRREYPVAVRRIRDAIAAAEAGGYLGERICGHAFTFRVQVREGAGAFVCGEETALIASLEGRRGMPRLRPPYPVQAGLHGQPTVVNNVETLACLPWIFREGAGAFAAMGTSTSRGTKVFSLAGKVRRGGLIEVPMGITIREIVEDIGGGVAGGRAFKAVLIGGPSGGCIPAAFADTAIDYEGLAATGAIMGSGGLVVLDDRDCMVEIARYFLNFTERESCGQCTFCRIGTKRMLEILERICAGRAAAADLRTLETLGAQVARASLCGLGQTAPNPVLTTLRYFREEYEAHVHERRCPAAQCKALVRYEVLETCTGCTLCAQACPVGAIEPRPYARHQVVDERCTRCGMCVAACPEHAIRVA